MEKSKGSKPAHDIIVVGASAGGVEALSALVQGLPADLPAALFVVLHIPSYSESHLPAILAHRGPLPAAHATHGEAIAPGCIYVAPPDHHLLVRHGHVELTRGPHENGSRPAVDPLFRSAARAYGPRVVGVVLSGALGDGSVGLMGIAARGGVTVVQDPEEALFESMPRTALTYVRVNHVLPVRQIPALVGRLAREPAAQEGAPTMSDIDEMMPHLVRRDITAQERDERSGETTVYTCPECGGTLWQVEHNGLAQFNCHVGHAYAPESLLGEMSEDLEAALWRCVRMLVEKATLTRQLAGRLRAAGQEAQAARVAQQAHLDDRHGQLIRTMVLEATPNPGTQPPDVKQALKEISRQGQPPASADGG
jgi:two-component system, chemotaxis family, protein-glutamate methylesterase/glutaminase